MPRPILLSVSLKAMSANLDKIRLNSLNYPSKTWAVIKANAYGHGIANAVQGFAAADGLAMIDVCDAVLCRHLGWSKPLLLLEGFFDASDIPVLLEHEISTVIHHRYQIQLLQEYAFNHASVLDSLQVWIKINSGMNRLGFAANESAEIDAVYQSLRQLGISSSNIGWMTHFANADSYDQSLNLQVKQAFDCFTQITAKYAGMRSVCNSAATWQYPEFNTNPEQDWVRTGISLYGSSPFTHRLVQELQLQPAQTLKAKILSIQHLKAGQAVGYGNQFVADKPMRVATIACGYADGYPRHATNQTPVMLNNQRTHLVGRVSMDMLGIDVTNLNAQVGDWVVLWGEDGPSIDEVARSAGTIGYELMCAIAARVPRQVLA